MKPDIQPALDCVLDSKREYISHIMDLLVEPIVHVMRDLYDKSRVIVSFQGELAKIPEWNKYQISESYNRLLQNSKCGYFPSLVKATIATCIRANLLAGGTDVSKVKVKVISAEDFYHRCLIASARSFWKRPHLFYHNMKPIEQQYNLSIVDTLVRKAIQTAIRSCIPYDEILTVIDASSPAPTAQDTQEQSDTQSSSESQEDSDSEEEASAELDDNLELNEDSATEDESDTEDENDISDIEVTRTFNEMALKPISEASNSDADTIEDSDNENAAGDDTETTDAVETENGCVTVEIENVNTVGSSIKHTEVSNGTITSTNLAEDINEGINEQSEDQLSQSSKGSIDEDGSVTLVRVGHDEVEDTEEPEKQITEDSSRKMITFTDFPVKKIHKPSLSKPKARNAFF